MESDGPYGASDGSGYGASACYLDGFHYGNGKLQSGNGCFDGFAEQPWQESAQEQRRGIGDTADGGYSGYGGSYGDGSGRLLYIDTGSPYVCGRHPIPSGGILQCCRARPRPSSENSHEPLRRRDCGKIRAEVLSGGSYGIYPGGDGNGYIVVADDDSLC